MVWFKVLEIFRLSGATRFVRFGFSCFFYGQRWWQYGVLLVFFLRLSFSVSIYLFYSLLAGERFSDLSRAMKRLGIVQFFGYYLGMMGVIALAVCLLFFFLGRSVHGVLHIKHVISICLCFLLFQTHPGFGDNGDGDYIRKCSFSSPYNSAGMRRKILYLKTYFLLSNQNHAQNIYVRIKA